MPAPLEILLDLVSLIVIGMYAGLMGWEAVFPARELPKVKHNYADLPLFDMLLGTFDNPKNYERETGFYPGASGRIKDMLIFKDINQPEAGLAEAPITKHA